MNINEFVRITKSSIHNNGVFARKDILRGTRIIEYVGEKISKVESERRSHKIMANHKSNSAKHGAVYIFELNKRHDIDGNVSWNPAKNINHSCTPNCEPVIIRGKIWIIAVRDIKKGEELLYNYGYDLDDYEEHKCKCGAKNCVGHIVSYEHWNKLRNKLVKKGKKLHSHWGKSVQDLYPNISYSFEE